MEPRVHLLRLSHSRRREGPAPGDVVAAGKWRDALGLSRALPPARDECLWLQGRPSVRNLTALVSENRRMLAKRSPPHVWLHVAPASIGPQVKRDPLGGDSPPA